ncbi:peptidoglycan DD-metalloendopeptidase family protein [Reyranella sp.]|jgi:murein DD-endopeptidase MepM/ murein hydrolase activator NlpD|uniref:peptidoglycan DD-metalloendopeptidase family protein n=1 Tax=Reyranella sp. TaxID=1929291 RepID=UPI002F941AA1
MTDFPSPSDRPRTARSAAFRLFRPVLFAVAAIAATVGAVIVIHHPPAPEVAAAPASPVPSASIVLPDPEPVPPLTTADFKGFELKPTDQEADSDKPAPDRYELTLRLERGDTVEKVLADINVPETDRRQIDAELKSLLKKRKLAVGESIDLQLQTVPEQPDAPRVLELSIRPQPQREYIVTRRDDGSYEAQEKIYKVSPRIVRVDAVRKGSLQQSGTRAGAPTTAILEFIRALSYDVDFQRELKEGQHFTLLLEQQVTSDGHVADPGRLLAGELRLAKRTITVMRFRPHAGADGFYDPKGESVVRSFLRTPMDASHVTSGFGMRMHPILGFSAMHTGVDFGAPVGTPIFAAGAGKVVMAGPNGGYGIFVKLQHTSQIGTGYGHMSRLGPGIRPGVSVRQGQVIGFVGSTGLATGPHLHYEFYRNGHPVNPLAQKFAMRAALGGKDLVRFRTLSRQYLSELKNAPSLAEASLPAKAKESAAAQFARDE